VPASLLAALEKCWTGNFAKLWMSPSGFAAPTATSLDASDGVLESLSQFGAAFPPGCRPRAMLVALMKWCARLKEPLLTLKVAKDALFIAATEDTQGLRFHLNSLLLKWGQSHRDLVVTLISTVSAMVKREPTKMVQDRRAYAALVLTPCLFRIPVPGPTDPAPPSWLSATTALELFLEYSYSADHSEVPRMPCKVPHPGDMVGAPGRLRARTMEAFKTLWEKGGAAHRSEIFSVHQFSSEDVSSEGGQLRRRLQEEGEDVSDDSSSHSQSKVRPPPVRTQHLLTPPLPSSF
jgi:hypothetical protein